MVSAVGFAIAKPLSRVPENTIKFGCSLMMLSLGIFTFGEGVGFAWPGADLSVLALLAMIGGLSYVAVQRLKVPAEKDLTLPTQKGMVQA
jgi:uncharacterized membrane protein